MKKTSIIALLILLGAFLPSCVNHEGLVEEPTSSGVVESYGQKKISESEALAIADKLLGRKSARSGEQGLPTIDYVSSRTSRSGDGSDTLAYIINYANNSGFAIISSDKRVYPVLAYSACNGFSADNEMARDYFLDRIEDYVTSESTRAALPPTSPNYFVSTVVEPQIVTQVHQLAPFNQYVVQEHPDCPAGCMPVASALIILHTQDELIGYHDLNFSCRMVRNAMKDIFFPPSQDELNTLQPPAYTYYEAVDYISKLLYWLGKDVSLIYTKKGSGAPKGAFGSMLKKAGVNIAAIEPYSLYEVAELLKTGHLVGLVGDGISDQGGHAWVADGLEYHIDFTTGSTFRYLHCD